ncbi:MAG: Nif3-like dinuclear metal center hexameric protein [Candidatus Kapaibacterium sp.]
MELSKLVNIFELEFPPKTAWSDDSIGLQISNSKSRIKNVYLTLELNEDSISEALLYSSDLIVTFHPLIFRPLSTITTDNRVGNLVSKLIKNDIGLYVIHTNFDSHPYGTSYEFCKQLGFECSKFLIPDVNIDGYGMGVIIELENSIKINKLLEKVSDICNSPLKYNIGVNDNITKIAIIGGSGSSYIQEAYKLGCDVFITADIKYHDFHSVEGKMAIIDPGHYEMEQFVPIAMKNILKEKLGEGINIITGNVLTNPVNYYPEHNYKESQKKYLNNYKG